MTVDLFIENISKHDDTDCYENQYRDEQKKQNLRVYFNAMYQRQPKVLFVGEAPGYLGCGITGVPFTDERIIKSEEYKNIPGKKDYIVSGTQKERSAKAIWDILSEIDELPLMWNSFPFHPFNKGNSSSNRTPSWDEKNTIGVQYLKWVIEIFEIEKVYAIGLQAFETLRKMNLGEKFVDDKNISYIRHPSYGGKNECQKKMREIFGKF